MAIPDPFTEPELMQWMHAELGDVAAELDWTVAASSYRHPVDKTLLAYGELDLSQITGTDNLVKLLALAEREAWRHAANSFAAKYTYSTATESYSMRDLPANIQVPLRRAEAQAAPYDSSGSGDARLRPLPGPRTPYDANPAGDIEFGVYA